VTMSPLGSLATIFLTVAALADGRWWVWNSRWND
jgi:hypothetical protein